MSILVLTSDTLIGTPATGNLEYNGQFYGTDSNASRAQMQRITQGTAVASTSGTSIDFTGIPAWVKRITVMFSGVSTSGSSNFLVQIGYQSPVTSTGYVSGSTIGTTSSFSTAGMVITTGAAGNTWGGIMTLATLGSNVWVATHGVGRSIDGGSSSGGGNVTLSGTLDRVRITTVNGTDLFDAGSLNILYEG